MTPHTTRRRRLRRIQRWLANLLFVLASMALAFVIYVRFFDEPASAPTVPTAPIDAEFVQVAQIIDGDTIDVLVDGTTYRLRYIGIDTPEIGESLADLATARNRALLTGKTVRIVKDVSETDRYGRLLRYVYLEDGRLVNEILVQEGLADAVSYPPDTKLDERLRDAEYGAQVAKRGIWAEEK